MRHPASTDRQSEETQQHTPVPKGAAAEAAAPFFIPGRRSTCGKFESVSICHLLSEIRTSGPDHRARKNRNPGSKLLRIWGQDRHGSHSPEAGPFPRPLQ